MFYRIKNIYNGTCLIIVPVTSSIGFFSNVINTAFNNKNNYSASQHFTNTIGYTTIGFITGVTYPISFPLIAYYTIKKID